MAASMAALHRRTVLDSPPQALYHVVLPGLCGPGESGCLHDVQRKKSCTASCLLVKLNDLLLKQAPSETKECYRTTHSEYSFVNLAPRLRDHLL